MLDPDGTPVAEEAVEAIGADVEDAEVVEEAAESPPPKATDAKPETPMPDVPRDERGRFAEKPSTPAPEAQAGTPAETPAEPTAPEAPEIQYPVATYRADGQEHELSGSAVGKDGIFIDHQSWQRDVLPLLAAGRAARGGSLQKRLQESAQQVQSWQQQAQQAQAQSQAIIAKIDQMVESGTIGQWLEDVSTQWPIMKARAEAEALRMQQQAQAQQLKTFQDEQQRQNLEPQFSQALEQSLMHFGADLDQRQLEGLYQQLNAPELRRSLFVQVQQDDPMTGLRAGEWAIDNGLVQRWVDWAKQFQPKTTIPPKVVEAQKQNEKKAAAAPPPTVGSKGGAAPSDKPKPKKYKDGKEALEKIFDDEEFQNFEVE